MNALYLSCIPFAVTVMSTLPKPIVIGSLTLACMFAGIVPLASPPKNTDPSTFIDQSTG
jgi:hypothetical protein